MALTELGFFATILQQNMGQPPSRLSQSSPFDLTVETSNFTVGIKRFADTQVLCDEAGEVTVVFYGHICGDVTLSHLINAYKAQGVAFVESLNGSFAFFLVDKPRDQIVLATDRLCSRKIYMRNKDSMTVVSTVLRYLFTDDLSIDPIGLAWYLANGVFHCNRTIFEGVSVVDRASCYIIRAHVPAEVRTYWQYQFTDEYAHKDPAQIREELEFLLVESVSKRVDENSVNLLSLSAGYDSPGVLGILSKRLDVNHLCSFSHGLYEDDKEGDAHIARRLAEMCGVEHLLFLPYDGDLCGTIERNALWGNGVAHFCDESFLWDEFSDKYANQNCTLFVADECFGGIGGSPELFFNADILAICKLWDFSCLRWLKCFLPHGVYRMFLDGQREDVATLFDRAPDATDIYGVKDWIYLDQRLSCVHMPWREYFSSRTFRVQNPFLDSDILDFMRKVPSQWRRGKRLYKETIASMFPEIFAVKRAKVGGFVPDPVWIKDMFRERELLIARYLPNGQSSLLDEFIAPDNVVKLFLMEEEIPDKIGLAVEKVISLSHRVVNKVMREVGVKKIKKRRKPMLGRTEFLLRYLVLRRFLEIAERDSLLLKF